jgi:benzodiazapine receptor
VLLLLNLVLVRLFWRIRRLAGWLMLPSVAWLGFAAALNFEIHRLNPDASHLAPGAADTQIQL